MASRDIDILARTLFGESEANNAMDAEAIACVILNRVNYPNWPDNIEGVCLQAFQFSCWNQNDPNRDRILKAKGPWFERCLAVADDAANGLLADHTNGATHYYATYVKKPSWAKGKTPCFEVKHKNGHSHLFFNDIDTLPPQNASEALDQSRPLDTTRTVKAGRVATAATVATPLVDNIDAIAPAVPLLQTVAEYAPWVLGIIALAAIGYIIYARVDDRNKGIH